MKNWHFSIAPLRPLLLVPLLALVSCSERSVVATHTMSDGSVLEIVGKPGDEHFLIYGVEVHSPSGELIYEEGFGDIPYGYSGGFVVEAKDQTVVIRRDDTDLGYLTTYQHRPAKPTK